MFAESSSVRLIRISCVASGTNDPANQAILNMVSRYDMEGLRAVGVITKCDVTQDKQQVR